MLGGRRAGEIIQRQSIGTVEKRECWDVPLVSTFLEDVAEQDWLRPWLPLSAFAWRAVAGERAIYMRLKPSRGEHQSSDPLEWNKVFLAGYVRSGRSHRRLTRISGPESKGPNWAGDVIEWYRISVMEYPRQGFDRIGACWYVYYRGPSSMISNWWNIRNIPMIQKTMKKGTYFAVMNVMSDSKASALYERNFERSNQHPEIRRQPYNANMPIPWTIQKIKKEAFPYLSKTTEVRTNK